MSPVMIWKCIERQCIARSCIASCVISRLRRWDILPNTCEDTVVCTISVLHLMQKVMSGEVLGMKAHACDVCNKTFAAARHLRVHYRIHTQEKRYQCHICDRGFIRYGSLLSHLKRFHNQPSDYGHQRDSSILNHKQKLARNFCGTCNKRVRSLADHLKKVHGEPCQPMDSRMLCMVCGKQLEYLTKKMLTRYCFDG